MKNCATCQTSYPSDLEVCPQDGTALLEIDAWPPGTVIGGRYVIFSRIAEGRLTVTYKAREIPRDAPRALRTLVPGLAHESALVSEFKRQALALGRLKHPNVAGVEASEEARDGRPFLVMEYAEGPSLRQILEEEGRLAARRVGTIAGQIASALEAAHRLGILHGDLRPTNVVLTEPGERVKLLGFGNAALAEACRQRADGDAAGLLPRELIATEPEYVSPERALGARGDELDGRSDLYALGLLMYEMLAGAPPFAGRQAESALDTLVAHLELPPPSFPADNHVPADLATLVARLLEKRRELRPATAACVRQAIERLEQTLATAAVPLTEPARAIAIQERQELVEATVTPSQVAASPSPASAELALAAPHAISERPIEPVPIHSVLFRPAILSQGTNRKGWVAVAIVLALGLGGWWAFNLYRPELSGGLRSGFRRLPPSLQGSSPRAATAGSAPTTRAESSAHEAVPGNGTPEETAPAATAGAEQGKGTAAAGKSPPTGEAGPNRGVSSSAAAPKHPAAPGRARPAITRVAAHSTVEPQARISAAEIQRVLAEGDALFERGDYDRAILVYEGPLGFDPTNDLLKQRIARARRAKAAEEKYLGQ